jgi:hypothetical protein
MEVVVDLVDKSTVAQVLVALLKERLLSWQVASAIFLELSRRGLGRAAILELCSSIIGEDARWGLSEEDLDALTDLSGCLIGQCDIRYIIRLAGDPSDQAELATYVCSVDWRVADPK